MKYVVHAYDGPDAAERRAAARPAHLAAALDLWRAGKLRFGGALLDGEGRMIGSLLILDLDDPAELEAWRATEPYLLGGVWERVDVRPCREVDFAALAG